jgi:hypothetical protein
MISTQKIIAKAKEYSTEGGKCKGSLKEDLAFTAGAMWMRKIMIDEACEVIDVMTEGRLGKRFLNEFRQHLEEEK